MLRPRVTSKSWFPAVLSVVGLAQKHSGQMPGLPHICQDYCPICGNPPRKFQRRGRCVPIITQGGMVLEITQCIIYGGGHDGTMGGTANRARGGLRPGESVLVHARAAGLGPAAIQLVVAAGAHVLATAGGPEKTAKCRELGAKVAIDYRSEDLATRSSRRRTGAAWTLCSMA
jgi:Zinc-binding dehydrogenase